MPTFSDNRAHDFYTEPNKAVNPGDVHYTGKPGYVAQLMHGLLYKAREEAGADAPLYIGPRVAEFSPIQQQAFQSTLDSYSRQKGTPAYKGMRDDIQKSQNINPTVNMSRYMGEARRRPDEGYIQEYLKRFHHNVVTPMWDEKTKEFLERINPAIAGDFASAGAYNSGAREAVQRRTARDLAKHLQTETGRLMSGAEERGMEYGHRHGMKNLALAELTGKTNQQEREMALMNAGALGNLERMQSEQERLYAQQLGQVGYTQQEQRQREIEEEKKKHYEQADHVKKNLTWEANLIAGHPSSVQASYSAAAAPPAPNYAAMGASALQQVPAIASPQIRKSGGRVRGYAPGGHVLPPAYQDSQLPAFNTPEMHNIRQTANDLGNTHPNNGAMSMGIAGATMGQHLGGPWGAYSAGNKAGFENYQNVQQSQYANKERGANLMAKINDSRLAQHAVLNAYDQKQKGFEEQKRLNNSTINMNNAHAASYRSGKKGQAPIEPITIGDVTINPSRKIGMTPSDINEMKDMEKSLAEYRVRSAPYENLHDFLNVPEGKEADLPMTGLRAQYTPNISDKSQEYSRLLNDVVSSKLPKGNFSKGMQQFAQASKPTERQSPENVKAFAEKGIEFWKEATEPLEAVRQFAAYDIPPRITMGAYQEWVKDGKKKGQLVSYVKAIMEGTLVPKTSDSTQTSDGNLTKDVDITGSGFTQEQVMNAIGSS